MRIPARLHTVLCFSTAAATLWLTSSARGAGNEPVSAESEPASEFKSINRELGALAQADNLEVTLSEVEIPAHTALPKHWHPGEEFIYVLEGSATIWQEGKPDTQLKAGDVFRVPLKQIHTAMTHDESVKVVVFRVHEKGQPVRVLVD